MTVVSVDKDFDNLTLTVVAHFDAPIERVWQLWGDPRLLERWWGPPDYPATVEHHDLTVGGEVAYAMTAPTGEKSRAWWRVTAVDPPRSLEVVDGWADQEGRPVAGAPTTTIQVQLAEDEDAGGTRMTVRSIFDSREHMEQMDGLGAIEVFRQTIGQMDALLPG